MRVDALIEAMRRTREAYKSLLLEKMKAPDGSYDANLVLPGTSALKMKGRGVPSASASSPSGNIAGSGVDVAGIHPRFESSANLEFNNPLSLHDEVCTTLTAFLPLINRH